MRAKGWLQRQREMRGGSAMNARNGKSENLFAFVALAAVALAIGFSAPRLEWAASAKSGEETFNAKCAMCHGQDGSGNTAVGKNLKLRDLRSKEVQAESDKQLYDITAKGKGRMPGYEGKLGKADIENLVAYIRELGRKK